jgi:cation:H+ antiporter
VRGRKERMLWSSLLPFALFAIGVVAVIWATNRLLEGLVGLAGLLKVSTFAIAAILSGFEAENVAVGLAAARSGAEEVALGTVFGGATFLVCIALGLGALLYPLRVTMPRGFLILMAICPVLVGVGLLGGRTSRPAGAVLLLAFAAAVFYLVRVSRDHAFLESEEVREAEEEPRSYPAATGLTVLGLVVIAVGGELVTQGAEGIVSVLGLSTLLVGMVVTPAAIEIEEVVRQAVPAREGRPEVSAGNLVGTLLYFLWFNLGLIALIFPVRADPLVLRLDWPYLIGVTWLATLFFARGRVGRVEGLVLVALYCVYIALHIVIHDG